MGEETPKPASTPMGAVFVSYASQDAEAARRICDALRAAGIEVWFDQSELRGGDVWDQKIRRQIRDCALFIPVISANTASRHEGYFRLEWDLADERTHRMARDRAFIVPVSLDATRNSGTDMPESFHRAQWTRLPGGETPAAFVQSVQRLLSPDSSTTSRPATGGMATAPGVREPSRASLWSKPATRAIVAALFSALASLVAYKLWSPKQVTDAPPATSASPATAPTTTAAAFNPPPHSIAVLPFVNMSGDREQEYFSEGLTEELLNSLSRIDELQVAARTSSFSFQGEHPDISTVAHKLNVGAVLEGSVRRGGDTVRITAQLINAVTGFHLWSQTYDRDLKDALKLQTEIATAVASALKVTLLGDEAAKIELGGTRNPAALDAYLRGSKSLDAGAASDVKGYQAAIASFTEAVQLDPSFAFAFARRSMAYSSIASDFPTSVAERRETFDRAQTDARKAIELAPDLAEGHLALAEIYRNGSLDFEQASAEYERALALSPGNVRVLAGYSRVMRDIGHADAAIAAARHAVVLDPLNVSSHETLGVVFLFTHNFKQAVDAFHDALVLDPKGRSLYVFRGFAYYNLGDLQSARASCETYPDFWWSQLCLAVTYYKLGRHGDAEVMRARIQHAFGDAQAYSYAEIYAQWGDTAKALEWLETALRLRDASLPLMKGDPLLDPLRNEPRFQAIERELKFPSN